MKNRAGVWENFLFSFRPYAFSFIFTFLASTTVVNMDGSTTCKCDKKFFVKTRTQQQIQFWQRNSEVCSPFFICIVVLSFVLFFLFTSLFFFHFLDGLSAHKMKNFIPSASLLAEIRTQTLKQRIADDSANFHVLVQKGKHKFTCNCFTQMNIVYFYDIH